MLDVINLRKNHQQLFWNLIYRFMLEKRDHMFILPYDIDLFPDAYKDDMKNYELQVKTPAGKLHEVMEDHEEEASKSSIPLDDMKVDGFQMTLQPHKRKELIEYFEKNYDASSSDEDKIKENNQNNIYEAVTPDVSESQIKAEIEGVNENLNHKNESFEIEPKEETKNDFQDTEGNETEDIAIENNIEQDKPLEQKEDEEPVVKIYEEKVQSNVNSTKTIVTTKIIQDIKEHIVDANRLEESKIENNVNPQQPQSEIIDKPIKPHEMNEEERRKVVEMIFPSFKGHYN